MLEIRDLSITLQTARGPKKLCNMLISRFQLVQRLVLSGKVVAVKRCYVMPSCNCFGVPKL